jgi:outer membrane protein assembly factor BamD (BamD/ComL family)
MIDFNETIWSAVKRKDMKMLLEELFTQLGYEDAAAEVAKTSRWTPAAVGRMMVLVPTKEVEEDIEEVEEDATELDYQEDINEEAEVNNELIKLEKKVRKAIESGDYKKAKKAFKKLEETGLGGSEMKELKKQIKAIK